MKPGSKTPRTRVSGEARRALILREARDMVEQGGFAAASLNEIVRRCGGSKASIAAHFGNKAGLFAAVLAEVTEAFAADTLAVRSGEDPVPGLARLGRQVLAFYLRPGALMTYRALVGVGFRHPALARHFYDEGHGRIVDRIADALVDWDRAGLLKVKVAQAEADRFLHLLRSGPYEQTLLGLRAAPSAREISAIARAAARTLVDGLAADKTAAG